jgi:hypothetical protein
MMDEMMLSLFGEKRKAQRAGALAWPVEKLHNIKNESKVLSLDSYM